MTTAWKPGEPVYWRQVPRGGYGFTQAVPSKVVRVTPKRVVIAALLTTGKTREITVLPTSLYRPSSNEAWTREWCSKDGNL